MLMSALVFYFVNRNHLKFETLLNSNWFGFYKKISNWKAISLLLSRVGGNPPAA
jgi:hypothetical protein